MTDMTQSARFQRPKQNRRRGVATVELAVCLPVLLLLVVGAIEGSNFIFLKQAVSAAAYEAAQVASRSNGLKTEADKRARQVLTARSIDNSTVVFTPSDPQAATRGSMVAVTVSAPVSANSIGLSWFFDNRTVTATTRMMKD
jgi:Flp pilus assembly protein TadG